MEPLCKIRDIYRAISEFEEQFEKVYNLCLNEGMLLCSLLKEDMITSGELALLLSLTHSNTSKVIASVEKKGFVKRIPDKVDRRQMRLTLTPAGRARIESIHCNPPELPEMLRTLLSEPTSQQ